MYSQAISSSSPSCLIFLLDQSFSMAESLPGSTTTKAQALADALNRSLVELISWAWHGATLGHYFDIGVLGYTTDRSGTPQVRSLLPGPLAGRDLVSVVELANNPLAVDVCQSDDGSGNLIELKFPIWYRVAPTTTMLGTPTCAGLHRCRDIAAAWVATHASSFPPAVVHVTDGEATDGDPEPAAEELKAVATQDGNLLLCSWQLCALAKSTTIFPTAERPLAGDWARLLFRMSSVLPSQSRQLFEARGIPAGPGARCLAINGDATQMLALYRTDDEVMLTLDRDEPTATTSAVPTSGPRPPYRVPRCPACDRKAPGLPGKRYCMVCDRTF
ncbi:MAG TPA: vWA domain-containing protein [Gemmataceae bacterium]|nr:vWA domain-containing protein [Gemmataceae bacterium]